MIPVKPTSTVNPAGLVFHAPEVAATWPVGCTVLYRNKRDITDYGIIENFQGPRPGNTQFSYVYIDHPAPAKS